MEKAIEDVLKIGTRDTSEDLFKQAGHSKNLAKAANISSFKNFMSRFKSFSGVTTDSISSTKRFLQTIDSGVSPLDVAVKRLDVTKTTQGFLKLSDEQVGTVNRILKEGNLDAIVRISKAGVNVTSADRAAVSTLVKDFPEVPLKRLSDSVETNIRAFPEMNGPLDSLSNTAKAKVQKVESNLLKYYKPGAVIAVTVGVIVVAADWITKTMEQRTGCFAFITINGKTSSCKISALSCSNTRNDGPCSNLSLTNYYNPTLVLMRIAELPNDDQRKIDVANAANVSPNELEDRLGSLMISKYEAMVSVVKSMTDKPSLEYCKIFNTNIENGKIPTCRMCDTSADPISTRFLNPDQLADNITFRCIEEPTVLSVITDAAITTGKNLFDGVTGIVSGASGSLQGFGIILIIGAILVLAFIIIYKFVIKKPATSPSYALLQPPPPIQQQQQPQLSTLSPLPSNLPPYIPLIE